MLRSLAVALAFLGSLVVPAAAQQPLRSECLAMANAPPRAMPVSLRRVAAKPQDVAITYVGHSTYYIDTPEGVRIGTDFNGVYRTGRLPDVVTMNRAHSTHYTLFPDPEDPARPARLGRKRTARAGLDARRRRLYPQRDHRHPPLLWRGCRRRDDQGRQLDLHLRGRRSLHRPSRPSCITSSTRRISRRSAGSIS